MARWAGAARRYGSVIWNDQELPQLTEQALASTPHRKWIEQVLQQGGGRTPPARCCACPRSITRKSQGRVRDTESAVSRKSVMTLPHLQRSEEAAAERTR